MDGVTVVVVNNNTPELAAECVRSVLESIGCGTVECIVVDNSERRALENGLLVPFGGAGVRVLRSENRGYGHACNQGARAGNGSLLVFLNADTQLSPESLRLVTEVAAEADVGIVGFDVREMKSGASAPCRFAFPHPPARVLRNLLLRRRPTRETALELMLPVVGNSTLEADWVLGAGLVMRRDVFESVGGFDENFFLYFEDIDLCRRVKQAGRRVMMVPGANLRHVKSASCGQLGEAAIYRERYRAQIRYFRKHYGAFGGLIARLDRSLLRWRA